MTYRIGLSGAPWRTTQINHRRNQVFDAHNHSKLTIFKDNTAVTVIRAIGGTA